LIFLVWIHFFPWAWAFLSPYFSTFKTNWIGKVVDVFPRSFTLQPHSITDIGEKGIFGEDNLGNWNLGLKKGFEGLEIGLVGGR